MSIPSPEYIIPALFVVAFLYSSVGHGGASGYLAVMALAGIDPSLMKSSALILNIFVAGIAFLLFSRAGHFNRRILLQFSITSVPAAFIGSQIPVNPAIYKMILGICLLCAVCRLLLKRSSPEKELKPLRWPVAISVGASVGFVSGMIGIGGGIILSPLLILFGWASMKEAAGISAAFILLNSISGLLGLVQKGFIPDAHMTIWIFAAIAGGAAGSYLGSNRVSAVTLKYVLANILCFAAVKLFMQ
jgi:uncharacterized membrane protein YfcA